MAGRSGSDDDIDGAEQAFLASDLSPGLNALTMNPPLSIEQQEVCIGVASPNPMGALGISVNESSLLDDRSYLRMERGGGCTFPDWVDTIDLGTNPDGNWCIRALIEGAP